MFTSAADIFRKRQVMADLNAFITISGRSALLRISPGDEGARRLLGILRTQGGRLVFPRDSRVYGEVLLAAALPDEDYPSFVCATALLLLDRIAGGDGGDNLYWNWETFSDQYRLADPPVRAALMNAFRLAAARGRVILPDCPRPADCLTTARDALLPGLRREGQVALLDAIEAEVSAVEAGALWSELARATHSPAMLAGFRYLFERPASLAPQRPARAPLIPWAL
jgi:hypothetical protein